MWSRANRARLSEASGRRTRSARTRDGARGLKVLKTLGLYLRENITTGPLVKVDDQRFDPMWEACGALKMPVAIHISDPEAFFLPIDRFNERFEELNNHPDWSFYGRDFPAQRGTAGGAQPRHRAASEDAVHRAPRGQFRRGPGQRVGRRWTGIPNMHVELAARIGELGRQPRSLAQVLRAATRTASCSAPTPSRTATTRRNRFSAILLYQIYFRFLETEDEYFDYAPAAVPPQGRWRIYGIGLPEGFSRRSTTRTPRDCSGVTV